MPPARPPSNRCCSPSSRIKCARIPDRHKRELAARELSALRATLERLSRPADFERIERELRAVNEALWEAEELIRKRDAKGAAAADLAELARTIYRQNDRRHALKAHLNRACRSDIQEVKSHA